MRHPAGGALPTDLAFWGTSLYITEDESAAVYRLDIGMRGLLLYHPRQGLEDMKKPVIALTMGDAAGIGPELVVKVLGQDAVCEQCSPLVVGDPQVMARACHVVDSALRVHAIDRLSQSHRRHPGGSCGQHATLHARDMARG